MALRPRRCPLSIHGHARLRPSIVLQTLLAPQPCFGPVVQDLGRSDHSFPPFEHLSGRPPIEHFETPVLSARLFDHGAFVVGEPRSPDPPIAFRRTHAQRVVYPDRTVFVADVVPISEAPKSVGSNGETVFRLKGKRAFEVDVWTFNRRCRLL